MQQNHPNVVREGGKLQGLPPELSIQILKECVPRVMDRQGRYLFLTLRTLCSQWRDICYNTPEFWSALAIDFDEEKEAEGGELKDIVQSAGRWFNRSGPGDHLELEATEEASFSEDEVHLFVQFVHDRASRWKSLELDVSDTVLMFVLQLPRQPVRWPSLHSLRVIMEGRFVDTRFLNLMPSLHRLQLELIAVDIPISPQIKSLEIHAFDPFFPGISLPSLYPSLTTLTLRFLDPCNIEPSNFELLETLNLVGGMDVLVQLDRIVCPILQGFSFVFRPYDEVDEEPLNHTLEQYRIIDFLRQSKKPIRSLHLSLARVHQSRGPEISIAQQLLKLLNGSLEEVKLGQWPWVGSRTGFEDIPALPRLCILRIGYVSSDDVESLVGWLIQRAEGIAQSTTEAKDRGRHTHFPQLHLAAERDRRGLPEDEVSKLVDEGAEVYVQEKVIAHNLHPESLVTSTE
jgi:F-box-like